MLRAGYCAACGTLCWRTATAQKDHDGTKAGEVFLLWPKPESVYAKVQTPTGYAPGIAYCPSCAPAIGAPFVGTVGIPEGSPVIGYETAHTRYTAWYDGTQEPFYRAWLHDHLYLEPFDVNRLMVQWDQDRHGSTA